MKIHSVTDNGTLLNSKNHPIESKSGDTTGDDKDKGTLLLCRRKKQKS